MTARSRRLLAVIATVGLLATFLATGSAGSAPPERSARCTIVGTPKADRLVGTGRRDVICGRGGNDVIKGAGGDDLLIGGGGRDELYGGPGDDRLRGGSGDDLTRGENGRDRLEGDGGNDELDGGPQVDAIDGGSGTNWCSTDPEDTQNRCVHDEAAAVAHELELSTPSIDVTDAERTVELRMHLTDDTGILTVQVGVQDFQEAHSAGGGMARLASGTVRDGWWTVTVRVSRWVEPADYEVWVAIRDRVNRWTHHTWFTPTLTVVDRTPDRSAPAVLALTAPGKGLVVDVRGAARTVHLRARLADTGSGIGEAYFCLMRPTADGYTNLPCDVPTKVSGTRNDGWWEGDVTIPRGAVGGDWNVAVWLDDRAHPGLTHYWMGPDNYRVWTADGWGEPRYHELPGGAGRFTVLGTSDSAPPVLAGLTATPSTVDTLPGPVDVTVRLHATDVEGVTRVGFALTKEQDSPTQLPPSFLVDEGWVLESGTRRDGVWKAVLTLPQGAAVGTYWFQAWVEDATHWRSYVSAGGPSAGQPNQEVMAWDPKVTVVP